MALMRQKQMKECECQIQLKTGERLKKAIVELSADPRTLGRWSEHEGRPARKVVNVRFNISRRPPQGNKYPGGSCAD